MMIDLLLGYQDDHKNKEASKWDQEASKRDQNEMSVRDQNNENTCDASTAWDQNNENVCGASTHLEEVTI